MLIEREREREIHTFLFFLRHYNFINIKTISSQILDFFY
jgi:hypothetical protein